MSSVQDCQTGRNYAYFRNTHAWRSPLSWEPAFLAHGYNCLWLHVPGICHRFHLVFFFFFDRTIPDLLGSDLMTTMVTLGIFLRGGLWKCYSWLFLFFSVGVPILWISILCFFLSLRCTGRALCFSFPFMFL